MYEDLIKNSAKNGFLIICGESYQRDAILKEAIKLGLSIPDPVVFNQFYHAPRARAYDTYLVHGKEMSRDRFLFRYPKFRKMGATHQIKEVDNDRHI